MAVFVTLHFRKRHLVILLTVLLLGLFVGGRGGSFSAIRADASIREGVPLTIIMYHGMLKDSKYQGKYVISPEQFESDLKYLKDHGYTTVTMADLFSYVDGDVSLPEKPIMLTFDDGYYNNYLYAYPLAQAYESKIIISPIGYYTDQFSQTEEVNANYSHMTWKQIKEMMDSGYVEFQNHSYNLHASKKGGRLGSKKLAGESLEAYTQMLTEDLSKMQREMTANTGYTPNTFVYPFGAVSKDSLPIIKSLGFQATLTCESQINYITKDPECLFGLGRYLRPSGVSSEKYFGKQLMLT